MDASSSAITTAANAADACRKIWQLCELWHNAPKDIMHLRDELARANEFFSMVQLTVTRKHDWARTADWVGQLTYELEECFQKAETVVQGIQANLNGLLDVSLGHGLDVHDKRRILWWKTHQDITRHRGDLKDVMFEICSMLAILDSSWSSNAVVDVKSHNLPMLGAPPHAEEARDVKEIGLYTGGNTSGTSASLGADALVSREDYSLGQHKSRWLEQKRLGARAVTIPGSIPRWSCPEGCICACHSVKNWGRWAVQSSLLGSLNVLYRGVLRRPMPCSNPRCKSVLGSQAKLVRMDVQPPPWLLRATMSVFLSFGLQSPELVIRVNRVTEYEDVHSSINQVLWFVQREEVAGVKHFLESREVRPDDIYGPADNGFTPIRLALDKKSKDVAQLLYHAGGFHGTLTGFAASSLLLWLEQDPSAADFLAQHFPLSAVIDEADYTTLHKIIMGLRHLDLHEYLRTPEGLAMVNQAHAHGRTPLHVAALRGNADAVLALLDAGADRDARGNHSKHALHYACKAGSTATVEALLSRGASLHVRDSLNRTPLFDVVGYGSNTNPDLVTHLLAKGIVQDPIDWVNATLLSLSNKRTSGLERLLPYWPAAHELPLYPAIHIAYPEGVRLLLAHGADYRSIDIFGEGILHWLAGSGLEMLRLFKGIGVSGVDVGMTDNMGKTAVQIMEERWDLTAEFRREFMELLDEVGNARVVEEVEDGPACTADLPEEKPWPPASPPAAEEVPVPHLEPDRPQLPHHEAPDIEALSAGAEREALDLRSGEFQAQEEEEFFDCETGMADGASTDSESGSIASGAETERLEAADEVVPSGDAEQKFPGSPVAAEHGADKVLTDEAGLKFLGTLAALRRR